MQLWTDFIEIAYFGRHKCLPATTHVHHLGFPPAIQVRKQSYKTFGFNPNFYYYHAINHEHGEKKTGVQFN